MTAGPGGATSPAGAELLTLAVEVAREAGALLLEYAQRRSLDVDTKTSRTDPVSEADHAAERLITSRLLDARPDDGVLGEEDAANRTGTSGLSWVVDPLDGTVNYLYGIPAWCVSVACQDGEGTLVGAVHDPNRGETFAAERGAGAWCDGRRLRVNQVEDLSLALVATGFGYGPEVRAVQGRWVADVLTRARDIRRVGAAALDLSWLAGGRFDGFYEFGLAPWDRAAGMLIVQEAGGVTSMPVLSAGGQRAPCVIAGCREIHDQLAAWLRGAAAP